MCGLLSCLFVCKKLACGRVAALLEQQCVTVDGKWL